MLGILDNSSFATYHPIVNFIYFMIILIINMSSFTIRWFLILCYIKRDLHDKAKSAVYITNNTDNHNCKPYVFP